MSNLNSNNNKMNFRTKIYFNKFIKNFFLD